MPRYLVKQKVAQWVVSEVEALTPMGALYQLQTNPPCAWAVENREEPTEVTINLIEEKK